MSLFSTILKVPKASYTVVYTPDIVFGIYIPFPGKNAIPIPNRIDPNVGIEKTVVFAPIEFPIPTVHGLFPPVFSKLCKYNIVL
ncbi:hypothetical protein FR483_n066L [Paramecium bursaria Chlorella virus FR483]|uniref:Uncharacterized protein n066L n=1 Tax=Paramecium bursaria Chlorella virus FR483 TaxID=399781 RepID=A7J6C0_PBCVF|nr:hypothetical protein FR483_n066L [Paramecium bursaria Chlorella virus FR483]ABT15351.1 hypothetical protein FR483_n066L [Paramecium bursaria Chlorella virus FR483]